MATLAKQFVVPVGLAPTYAAAAGGGDKVTPADNSWIHVKNGGGGSITVTVDDPTSQGPAGALAFNPDLSVAVPAAGERLIGPITARYANPADGLAAITYTGVVTVTIGSFGI